jgi:hypothetical protein
MPEAQLTLPMEIPPNARQHFIAIGWMIQCPTCENLLESDEAWEHATMCFGEYYDNDPSRRSSEERHVQVLRNREQVGDGVRRHPAA